MVWYIKLDNQVQRQKRVIVTKEYGSTDKNGLDLHPNRGSAWDPKSQMHLDNFIEAERFQQIHF